MKQLGYKGTKPIRFSSFRTTHDQRCGIKLILNVKLNVPVNGCNQKGMFTGNNKHLSGHKHKHMVKKLSKFLNDS